RRRRLRRRLGLRRPTEQPRRSRRRWPDRTSSRRSDRREKSWIERTCFATWLAPKNYNCSLRMGVRELDLRQFIPQANEVLFRKAQQIADAPLGAHPRPTGARIEVLQFRAGV